LLYSEKNWIPDFLEKISTPYCTWDETIKILKRFHDYEKGMNRNELENRLSEYGIFTLNKWKEEKATFDALENGK